MHGRKPDKFVLKPKDKIVLQELLRDGQTPLKVARRAQILLDRNHEQQRVVLLGEKVDQDPATIWRVCERYRQGGLEAALVRCATFRSPARFFPPPERKAIEDLACQAPASVGWEVTHWSQRSLAQAAANWNM